MVADAEKALANEPEINGIKSLNFRSVKWLCTVLYSW
jgi:hypothetical protein